MKKTMQMVSLLTLVVASTVMGVDLDTHAALFFGDDYFQDGNVTAQHNEKPTKEPPSTAEAKEEQKEVPVAQPATLKVDAAQVTHETVVDEASSTAKHSQNNNAVPESRERTPLRRSMRHAMDSSDEYQFLDDQLAVPGKPWSTMTWSERMPFLVTGGSMAVITMLVFYIEYQNGTFAK